jgi:hypothetical protein
MFRVTHRPSSGAQKLQLQPLVLHTLLVAGRFDGSAAECNKHAEGETHFTVLQEQ